MVQHNDKWKKKATREYHKKHGTQPSTRGRGRGRGIIEEVAEQPAPVDQPLGEESEEGESNQDSKDQSGDEEKEEAPKERSKYARRKIESNAWRFESEESDPYLSILPHTHITPLITVIDESALEPPEPDYAHLPARPFEPTKPHRPQVGKKNISIKESELAPLKAQIDKANAARAFKERFASGQKGNVVIIEDGVARRQVTRKEEEEEGDQDDDVDDIDTFLSELDMRAGPARFDCSADE